MGSKFSKLLVAGLAALALAAVPASAIANLDYSRNSVSGQYLPPQINDVSVPTASSPAPVKVVVPVAEPGSGFSWADASAGAGVALLIAFAGVGLARRRRITQLAG